MSEVSKTPPCCTQRPTDEEGCEVVAPGIIAKASDWPEPKVGQAPFRIDPETNKIYFWAKEVNSTADPYWYCIQL